MASARGTGPHHQLTPSLAALAALFLVLPLSGCKHAKETAQSSASLARTSAAPVETQTAQLGTAIRWTPVTGSLVALQDVPLSFRTGGRIASVLVREGDTVAPGQVVATLDTADQESQVRAALAGIAAAQAKVAQASAAYKQQLVSSRAALQAAEAAYGLQKVTTRTGVDSAKAALEAARAQLSQVKEGARSQEVRRAGTQVAIAQANLDKAEADVRRYRSLVRQGAVAKSVLETYETTAQVARENLRAAQEVLSLTKEGARAQEVTQADQMVRQAEEGLRRAQAGTAQDAVRRADVESARAALAQNEVRRSDVLAARATLKQLYSSLAIVRKALADSQLRSPIAGQVAARSSEPGEVVAAGAPVFRVVALDSVFFEPSVPDRDLAGVSLDQSVEVTVNAFPKRRFQGTVTKIYPAGSEKSRAFPIRITLSNPGGLLRPQMFAQGRIRSETHSSAVLVPLTAVLRSEGASGDGDSARLFTAEGGVAREHKVRLGLASEDGALVEVSSVAAGSQVITSGQRGLSDGDKVTATSAGGEPKVALRG
ncbi:MAG TPA: efflux RND transporter periplasmic adaptor subunit [Armatimonadota bacterium]